LYFVQLRIALLSKYKVSVLVQTVLKQEMIQSFRILEEKIS
jgi:hypothetical protein